MMGEKLWSSKNFGEKKESLSISKMFPDIIRKKSK